MSSQVREKAKDEYDKMMQNIDQKISLGRKQGQRLRELELGT